MNAYLEALRRWNVRRRFNAVRATFYREFAAALDSGAPVAGLIAKYASLNIGPVSAMMRLWDEGLRSKPDSLARATRGLVDSGDTIVIAAADNAKTNEKSSPGDLYRAYAYNLKLRDDMARAIFVPLIIPLLALVVIIGVMALFKFRLYPDMIKSVPLKYWPGYGLMPYEMVNTVFSLEGVAGMGFLLALVGALKIAMPRLTGALRDAMDRRIFPFTVIAQMELLSAINVLAALVQAGEPDVRSLNLISSNGSPWLGYQLEKVRARTRMGRTVLESLDDLPISPMLSARLFMLSKHARKEEMPRLVMDACTHEANMLHERMETTSKIITALAVIIIVVIVGVLALGNIGLTEATETMNNILLRRHR